MKWRCIAFFAFMASVMENEYDKADKMIELPKGQRNLFTIKGKTNFIVKESGRYHLVLVFWDCRQQITTNGVT